MLTLLYIKQRRLDDAEELSTGLCSIVIATQGLDAPFTLTCLSALASIYDLQGRGEQASLLLLDAFGIEVELRQENLESGRSVRRNL